ncbi:MAG: Trm112 family protein [Actinomycetales bacterium]
MTLDPQLMHVLTCPVDKGELHLLDDENCLYNPRLRRRYAIRDGIAVMLVEESEEVSAAEHERIMARIAKGESRVTGR